ncbi:GtrA family protein [Methylobacterium sp. J-070]|uniref:GtrA family protein n=1 Tax=Methylobacterium sp. J-070 TaxID=2836650 RepID=UPI001FBAEFEF|nr:GtrA family protein [Methylobacterium sp. J-070]MCJ2053867.1 GtrA family protein [Methylobacterium sp. J-070]
MLPEPDVSPREPGARSAASDDRPAPGLPGPVRRTRAVSRKDMDMPLDRLSLILRYAVFALLSIAINWLMQFLMLRTIPGASAIYVALFAGTGAGFAAKYLLDRNFIFYHTSSDHRQELWVMVLYLCTSVLMTGLYLASQGLMYYKYGECALYYVIGTLVLLCGYTTKFILDGQFVFKQSADGRSSSAQA